MSPLRTGLVAQEQPLANIRIALVHCEVVRSYIEGKGSTWQEVVGIIRDLDQQGRITCLKPFEKDLILGDYKQKRQVEVDMIVILILGQMVENCRRLFLREACQLYAHVGSRLRQEVELLDGCQVGADDDLERVFEVMERVDDLQSRICREVQLHRLGHEARRLLRGHRALINQLIELGHSDVELLLSLEQDGTVGSPSDHEVNQVEFACGVVQKYVTEISKGWQPLEARYRHTRDALDNDTCLRILRGFRPSIWRPLLNPLTRESSEAEMVTKLYAIICFEAAVAADMEEGELHLVDAAA